MNGRIAPTGLLYSDCRKTSQPSDYTDHTFTLIEGGSDRATSFRQDGQSEAVPAELAEFQSMYGQV